MWGPFNTHPRVCAVTGRVAACSGAATARSAAPHGALGPYVQAASPAPKKKGDQQVRELCAGAGAGAITKTAVAPLERVKILFQIQAMTPAKGKYRGIMPTLKTVVAEDGVRGLYKGNGANVVRVIPVYALKFALNDEFKRMLLSHPDEVIGGHKLLLAGTMAGAVQQLCTYPLEVVRTRLALCSTMGVQYRGIVDCAVQTLRLEGVRGLYKGLGPTLLSGAPYVGLQMTAFEVLKRFMSSNNDGKEPHLVVKLGLGAVSGLFAQTITYPGDTIRRRMQTNGVGGTERIYKTSWDCCVKTVRAEGIRGLYHGLWVNVIRCLPGAAIQFAAYDALKVLLGATPASKPQASASA